MPIQKTINKARVPVHIYTTDVDSLSMTQLANIADLPFIHHHVAAMPDVHAGIGAAVGSVIPTVGAVIPAAVGVDIGCGMNAVRTSLTASDLPDSLRQIRNAIEWRVPVGFNEHKNRAVKNSTIKALDKPLDSVLAKHPTLVKMMKNFHRRWHLQLATLGGGNHFIEICLDEDDAVWIMLHSGSRGIGNAIGHYFISLARKDMTRQQVRLPDKDLSYFVEGSDYFADYVEAVSWAQEYAWINRREMMKLAVQALENSGLPPFTLTKEAINCHHNYISHETHFGEKIIVTRKGAIRAGEGDLGIIPGSMGAKSYIVRGKGEADSFCSCSHGAGRAMSRSKAKKLFNSGDLKAQTAGVECRKDKDVVDEIPSAYKDIDEVMANQTDLVEIVHTLKQVVCVKG